MFKKIWNWFRAVGPPSPPVEVDWNIRAVNASPSLIDWVDEDFQQGQREPYSFCSWKALNDPTDQLGLSFAWKAYRASLDPSPFDKPYQSFHGGDKIQSPFKIEDSDNIPCTAASDSELEKKDAAAGIGGWLSYNMEGRHWEERLGQYVKDVKPKKTRKKAVKKTAKKKPAKKGKK